LLARFDALLQEAAFRSAAVGAFTCYDVEVARAVLAAAAARDRGVILLISRDAFAASGGEQLLAAVRAAAELAPARACVQLDHVSDLELMGRALDLGAGAVMADGSRLSYEDNIALVEAAQRMARDADGAVEAELGHVAGGEDVASATEAGQLTDPDEARRFVAATGVACLAVSIGNVHGDYAGPPRLDWPRLDALGAAVGVPLSLHGASGLPPGDVVRAVTAGIRKANVNTELRAAYLAATREALDAADDGLRVLHLHDTQIGAVRSVAEAKLDLLEGGPA
jgi:ketose-bisphosphate aldolase